MLGEVAHMLKIIINANKEVVSQSMLYLWVKSAIKVSIIVKLTLEYSEKC